MADNLSLPRLWSEEGGGRIVGIYEAQYYVYYLWALLNQELGISIDLGRRLIWLIPFFVGLFSMYSLTMFLFQNRIGSIISSFYFVSSNMTVWAAHVSWIQGVAALSLVPLVFAFFLKGVQGLNKISLLRNFLLSGVMLSVVVWYDMKIAVLGYALLISFSAFQTSRLLFGNRNNREAKATPALKYLIGLGTVAFLTIMLNLYTILPRLVTGGSGAPAVSSQPAYLNASARGSLLYSLLFTYSSPMQDMQVLPVFLAIISVTAFAAIILRRRCPWVMFFVLLSLVLVFLSKHTAPPFEAFPFYLYKYLPGYVAFRDPNKFLLFLALPVSILLGVSVSELGKNIHAYAVKIQAT
jgi:hypothetical protein